MNRKLVVTAVAASALALGGTTAAFAGGTEPAAAVQAQNDDRDDRGVDGDDGDDDGREGARALSGAELTAKEAIDKALASVDGTVESIELDDEDGGRVAWEADVLGTNGTWHEVRVDADSGKILQNGSDDREDDADDRKDDADDKGDRDDRDDD